MQFIPADIIGTIAATLTTLCFIPQAVKVIRTHQTRDISLSMYLMFTTGVGFWLAYGIMIERPPMIVANIVTFILALIIVTMKIRHG